jgi:hypothetical protein
VVIRSGNGRKTSKCCNDAAIKGTGTHLAEVAAVMGACTTFGWLPRFRNCL